MVLSLLVNDERLKEHLGNPEEPFRNSICVVHLKQFRTNLSVNFSIHHLFKFQVVAKPKINIWII